MQDYDFYFSGVLGEIVGKCVDGAKVLEVCSFGDERLLEETSKIYRKDKEIKKGKIFGTLSIRFHIVRVFFGSFLKCYCWSCRYCVPHMRVS